MQHGWRLEEAPLRINGEDYEKIVQELPPPIGLRKVLPDVLKLSPVLLNLLSPVLLGGYVWSKDRPPRPVRFATDAEQSSQIRKTGVGLSINNVWEPDAALVDETIPRNDAGRCRRRSINGSNGAVGAGRDRGSHQVKGLSWGLCCRQISSIESMLQLLIIFSLENDFQLIRQRHRVWFALERTALRR